MLWEPLNSILLVSRSKVTIFLSALWDLSSYVFFFFLIMGISEKPMEIHALNRKWLLLSGNDLTFLLLQLVLPFPDFSSESLMATEKRAALERQPCLRTTVTLSFGRQEAAGWVTQKYLVILLTSFSTIYYFLTTLHDNLIKTQTSKNQRSEY